MDTDELKSKQCDLFINLGYSRNLLQSLRVERAAFYFMREICLKTLMLHRQIYSEAHQTMIEVKMSKNGFIEFMNRKLCYNLSETLKYIKFVISLNILLSLISFDFFR